MLMSKSQLRQKHAFETKFWEAFYKSQFCQRLQCTTMAKTLSKSPFKDKLIRHNYT